MGEEPAERAEVPSGGLYFYRWRVPRASDVHEVGKEQLFILLGNNPSQNGLKYQHKIAMATHSMWHNQIEGCAPCSLTG